MAHNDYVRWEQGVNRIVQADLEDRGERGGSGGGDGQFDVIVRVNCLFDRTEETQLALMLPRERVQGKQLSFRVHTCLVRVDIHLF